MRTDELPGLPSLPEGYFFRIEPRPDVLGSDCVGVQLRQSRWWGSRKVDNIYCIPGDQKYPSPEEALVQAARVLVEVHEARLACQKATAAIARYYGDHPREDIYYA